MKKLLAAMLALLLLCVGTAFADVKPGDTVTVTFNCKSDLGIAAVFNVIYDQTVFQYVSATGGSSHSASRFGIINFGSAGFDKTVTYTFSIMSGAPAGTHHISASVSECSDLNENAVEATVTGSTSFTIAGSGCAHKDTTTIKGKLPTCIADGSTEKVLCINCGMAVKKAEVIPATGHTITALDPVMETVAGQELTVRFCYECGDAENADIWWRLFGTSGKLVRENIAADSAEVWECVLSFSEVGAYTVGVDASAPTLAESIVVIVHSEEAAALPEDLKLIENEAFVNVDAVEFILPEGLETIGSHAFADNEQLVLVNIPDTVASIAPNAFDNCPALTLVLSETNTYALEYAMTNEIPYVIR